MQFFGPFNMLTVHTCSDMVFFGDLSNPAFCSLYFQKKIISEGHLFFQSTSQFMQITKMQKKIRKIFFDFRDNSI